MHVLVKVLVDSGTTSNGLEILDGCPEGVDI